MYDNFFKHKIMNKSWKIDQKCNQPTACSTAKILMYAAELLLRYLSFLI